MATDTKDFGPVFFHGVTVVKGTGLVHLAPTQEMDPPFRRSTSLVIRLWPSCKAIVVGWWRKTDYDEETALFAGLRADLHLSGRADYDVKTDDEGQMLVRDRARHTVAANADDIDDEWLLLSALDLAS